MQGGNISTVLWTPYIYYCESLYATRARVKDIYKLRFSLLFPQIEAYILFQKNSTFQIWTSVPWMTSWSTPVVHVNKYIPNGSNQLIEEFIGTVGFIYTN